MSILGARMNLLCVSQGSGDRTKALARSWDHTESIDHSPDTVALIPISLINLLGSSEGGECPILQYA
jgi:hypothetical protein